MGKYPWSGKRTLEHCRLITKMGVKPRQHDGKCDGFQKAVNNDEPCNICMKCKLNTFYEEIEGQAGMSKATEHNNVVVFDDKGSLKMQIIVKCKYSFECASYNTNKCQKCTNNRMRNYVKDHFENANDKPVPENCQPLHYTGPAEQTAGYCCPVCGGFTNPYQLEDKNCCSHCGYRLNIGG